MSKEWMKLGACGRHPDPDLWFPEPPFTNTAKRAKKICNTECPVRDECREYAVTFPALLRGVWGGLTFREVRAARLARGIEVESEHEFSRLPVERKNYYAAAEADGGVQER